MGNQQQLQDVQDVIEVIEDELSKPTIRDWVGPTTHVTVTKLDATRAWRQHLPGLGVKLEGGLLRDTEGNHMFLSMLRRGGGVKI